MRFLSFLLFMGLTLSQRNYDIEHIYEKDGIFKKKYSGEVVDGKIYESKDGIDVQLGIIKSGLREGKWVNWYSHDKVKKEIYWVNGSPMKCYEYRRNGTVEIVTNYENEKKYVKTFFDKAGKIEKYKMEYLNGKAYHGSERIKFYISPPDIKVFEYLDPKILYYEKGKLIRTEYVSKRDGSVIKATIPWHIKRSVFKPIVWIAHNYKSLKSCVGTCSSIYGFYVLLK